MSISAPQPASAPPAAGTIFLVAWWFGLGSGLVEGTLYWFLLKLHWLSLGTAIQTVGSHQVWISAVFNGVLFLFVAAGLTGLSRMFRWSRWPAVVVGVFAGLSFFPWLALSGRVQGRAAAVLAAGLAFQFTRWFLNREARALAWLRATAVAVTLVTMGVALGLFGWEYASEKHEHSRLRTPRPGAPNVLLIVLDTGRADHFSAYGYSRATSPNMDRLAQQGALFERAYAPSSWTLPSHASMMTGRHLFEHKAAARTEWKVLGKEYPTLAEALQGQGYATAGFVANTVWTAPWTGLDRGFAHYESIYGSLEDMAERCFFGRKISQFLLPGFVRRKMTVWPPAQHISGQFLRWQQANSGRPFFAFLNYMELHEPPVALPPFHQRFAGAPDTSAAQDVWKLTAEDAALRERWIGDYDSAIASLDDQLRILFEALRTRGVLDNTVVVVTSDHGELFGEHQLFDHGNALYEGVLSVPLLIRYPGKIPAGQRIPEPVSLRDLPATVLDLVDAASALPGDSYARYWKGVPLGSEAQVLSEVDAADLDSLPKNWPVRQGWLKALIGPRWKLILRQDGGYELFDLKADLGEHVNQADTPEAQVVAAGLLQKLKTWVPEARVARTHK